MISCYFCGRTVQSHAEAISEGWIPSFVKRGEEHETEEPVCGECIGKYLEVSKNHHDFQERSDGTS